jgi:hypothetical protein
MVTGAQIEILFHTWWTQSYPSAPNTHALMTHVSWGEWLLQQQAPAQGGTTLAEAREEARQLAGPSAEVVHRYLARGDLPA